MKKTNYILILAFLILVSCKKRKKEIAIDNVELIELTDADQNERKNSELDPKLIYVKDSLRREKVIVLESEKKLKTSNDVYNAALIFQHGRDSTDYLKALNFIKKSIELDSTRNKWLFAAITDRYLLSIGKPQIYGTQYQKHGIDKPWRLGEIDTTKVSDDERIEFGVETLEQQREKVKRLNKEGIN